MTYFFSIETSNDEEKAELWMELSNKVIEESEINEWEEDGEIE